MSADLSLRFLGAANTVTGSRYFLSWRDRRVLVDCGMFQGYKYLRDKNWKPFPVPPESIEAILLTHAHLDHSGYIPALVAQGFRGKVWCTRATAELCEILWMDSGHLQEEEAAYLNKHKLSKHSPALPLYDQRHARAALDHLHYLKDGEQLALGDLRAEFLPNGHILGSASIAVEAAGRRILFSGDLGREHDPLMSPPAAPPAADYVVIESTYGNRLHDAGDPAGVIAELVNDTVQRGGAVLIPAFAVGRAQTVLFLLRQLQEEGRIPRLPIYLDSPMAIEVTELFCRYPQQHRLSTEQSAMMCSNITYTRTVEQSQALNSLSMPRIIVSASGMATGGRVLHHLRRLIGDDRNTVIFAGYQSGGTRGARLVNGEKRIKIFGQYLNVHAQIASLDSLSAHADRNELLGWLGKLPVAPKQLFVTHGEPDAADALRLHIQERFGWRACAPELGEEVVL